MVRRILTDDIWEQLQNTLKAKGCHRWKNDRQVMEGILWKLRTGAHRRAQARTGVICHLSFALENGL